MCKKGVNFLKIIMCCLEVTCGSVSLGNGQVTYSQALFNGGYARSICPADAVRVSATAEIG